MQWVERERFHFAYGSCKLRFDYLKVRKLVLNPMVNRIGSPLAIKHRPRRGCCFMAEREGFEPPVLSHGGFQDRCLQPLGHLSNGIQKDFIRKSGLQAEQNQNFYTMGLLHVGRNFTSPAARANSLDYYIVSKVGRFEPPVLSHGGLSFVRLRSAGFAVASRRDSLKLPRLLYFSKVGREPRPLPSTTRPPLRRDTKEFYTKIGITGRTKPKFLYSAIIPRR